MLVVTLFSLLIKLDSIAILSHHVHLERSSFGHPHVLRLFGTFSFPVID